jgi:hypothetical protein
VLPDTLLDMDRLEAALPELAASHRAAVPFPHTVLDDVVCPGVIDRLYEEHEAIPESTWANYLHLNERKYANTEAASWGATLHAVGRALMSDRFVSFLSELTGIPDLLADPSMDGGGLHRSRRGGFLNVHADFTAHHDDPKLRRRVNLLLYLNRHWDPAWGGALELWSADMQHCEAAVVPRGNRIVIFTTTETSFHGHPDPLQCPPEVARRSLALYYFTAEERVRVRSTEYRARPTDGVRGIGIYLDKQLLRAYDRVKRRFGLSDGLVSRSLGRLHARRGREGGPPASP